MSLESMNLHCRLFDSKTLVRIEVSVVYIYYKNIKIPISHSAEN